LTSEKRAVSMISFEQFIFLLKKYDEKFIKKLTTGSLQTYGDNHVYNLIMVNENATEYQGAK